MCNEDNSEDNNQHKITSRNNRQEDESLSTGVYKSDYLETYKTLTPAPFASNTSFITIVYVMIKSVYINRFV